MQGQNLINGVTTADVARVCYLTDQIQTAFLRGGGILEESAIVPFAQAPPEQREILTGLAKTILITPTITPAEVHASWVQAMKSRDWTRGATLDTPNRRHPLLVPYDELSENDKLRPVTFLQVVRGLTETPTTGQGTTTETTERVAQEVTY